MANQTTNSDQQSRLGEGEANKRLVRRYWEEVCQGHPDVADEIFGPEHQHMPWSATRGPESVKEFLAVFLAIFPDVQVAVQHLVAEGDLVVADVILTGTQTGQFWGIAPTGKRVSAREMCFFRIHEGKIVARWYIFDGMSAVRQLGATVQPPA